jgi:hypothetical protein
VGRAAERAGLRGALREAKQHDFGFGITPRKWICRDSPIIFCAFGYIELR